MEAAVFYVVAGLLVAAAVGVITVRNPVYAALLLVFAFFNSAILWLLLEAEFLAIVLVLVYVGAVMVLFLFVVMMLDINTAKVHDKFLRYAPFGFVLALVVVAEILYAVWAKQGGFATTANPPAAGPGYSNTEELGTLLYTAYIYPFEIASVILLAAIIAAITLTMRRRPGLRQQDITEQVSTRREDRVRLVKMAAEPKAAIGKEEGGA